MTQTGPAAPAPAPAPALPLIDLSPYLAPQHPGDRERVVEQVREAARQHGFFQVTGHGIPLELQRDLVRCMDKLFGLPREAKLAMSFLENPCRRGYEAAGMSLREGDALPDAKECFFLARDDPAVELSGFFGPNVWPPDLPDGDFRRPAQAYYEHSVALGKTVWRILLEGLGQPGDLVEAFAARPVVPMKMIRYPPHRTVRAGQLGIGAHTDFGGVTVLFQQPGKDGLEVWDDARAAWIPVPALEDVYVINCGDMVQRWSAGAYKSARHRVLNKADGERLSCATFWHGDINASNPLRPHDPDRETVGQLLVKRFRSQYSITKEAVAQVGLV
ncbi:2OG-Fe(II) oxygenase [Lasiosphaeria miniovina]|uniref:2OG-Fe(II) oxygenase n=1 Tax=Lasiosphaeria miniovina TaxID=1954250 RepID=A0AA40B6X8_9PEZI|nr:2OG-Fe(II) oxygenase [Lasiosphaeria miniovina]KAK0728815.1 2OG-Fe(II) oxygenase [Lasiosphaeria miniovina]